MQGTYLSVEICVANTTACPCMFFLLCYFNVWGKAAAEHPGAPFFCANVFYSSFLRKKKSIQKGQQNFKRSRRNSTPLGAYSFSVAIKQTIAATQEQGSNTRQKGRTKKMYSTFSLVRPLPLDGVFAA